jgi:O-antigen/teichoic acid export membrane protein
MAVYARQSAFALVRGLLERAAQLTLLASLVLALLTGVGAWLIAGGTVTPSVLAFWAAAAALPAMSLGRVMQSGLMGLHHVVLGQFPDYVLRPALLLVLVSLGIVAMGPVLSAPAAVALYATSAWAAALVAIFLLRARRPAERRGAPAEYRTRTWLWATVALATLSSAAIINTQAGVVMLGLLGGPDSTGLYAVAQRGALLVAFPLAAVNAAIAPTAARLWSGGDHAALRRLVTVSARGVLLASLPVALTFVVFGRPILSLLFGAEFGDADLALAIVSLGQVVNAATGSVAVLLMMTSHQRQATIAIALGALVNVVLGGVLIPGLQESGAAIAAAASLVVSNGLMVIVTRRSLGIDPTALGRHPRGAQ